MPQGSSGHLVTLLILGIFSFVPSFFPEAVHALLLQCSAFIQKLGYPKRESTREVISTAAPTSACAWAG